MDVWGHLPHSRATYKFSSDGLCEQGSQNTKFLIFQVWTKRPKLWAPISQNL